MALYQDVLAEGRFFISDVDEYTATPEWMAEVIRGAARRSHSCFLVARRGGGIVGALTVAGGSLRRTRHVGRLEVYVCQAARGGGIGRELMEIVIGWARELPQMRKLSLAVFEDNTRAVTLYEDLGFATEGRRVGEYRERDGKLRTDLLMWLDVG